jgi:hypothetical protein
MIDDLLFEPIPMSKKEKDFIWKMVERTLGNFDIATIEGLEAGNAVWEEFMKQIDEVGPIEILNKSDVRAIVEEKE